MTKLQIAVLDAGLHHKVSFTGSGMTHLRITPGCALAPERFDLFIVPFHTDHAALAGC